MGEPSISRLLIDFMNESSTITLGYTIGTMQPRIKAATVSVWRGSLNQPVNSSRCQIAGLEVYRGRERAISISYNGFSLSNRSTLLVSTSLHNIKEVSVYNH